MLSERKISTRRPVVRVGLAALALSLFQMVPAAGTGIGTLAYPATDQVVSNVEPGTTSTSVQCPSDHPVVTGGGLDITGDESTLDLEVNTTLPMRHLKGWAAAANNSSASDASMHVIAICAHGHVVEAQAHKSVPANTQGSLKVMCPKGTTVVGGGAGITGSTHLQEVATTKPIDGRDRDHKPDDGWAGRANNGLLTQQTLKVDAVCASAGSYRYLHASLAPVPDGEQGSQSLFCPDGTFITGGGVGITGTSLGTEVGDSFPVDGADLDTTPNNGWQASANNDSTGSTQMMQVFAICQK